MMGLEQGSSGGVGEVGSAEWFADATAVLARSPVPAVVLEVPTERIVAASTSGGLVLDPDGGTVVGRNFEDFTTDGPSGVLDLFAAGRLTGYETTRQLRRTGRDSVPVSVWLHSFDDHPPSRFALAMLSVSDPPADLATAPDSCEPTVVGTTDPASRIARISNDTEEVFGLSRAALRGRSLADVVTEADQTDVAEAIMEAATQNRAVSLYVHTAAPGGDQAAPTATTGPTTQELVILPMEPSPSCAYVFLRVREGQELVRASGQELSNLLARLRHAWQVGGVARRLSGLDDEDVPGLDELTVREWEIVTRLLDGDRVPAIADALFLSQSAVRSHLGAVFGKLNVGSQQELLDLLRGRHSSCPA